MLSTQDAFRVHWQWGFWKEAVFLVLGTSGAEEGQAAKMPHHQWASDVRQCPYQVAMTSTNALANGHLHKCQDDMTSYGFGKWALPAVHGVLHVGRHYTHTHKKKKNRAQKKLNLAVTCRQCTRRAYTPCPFFLLK